MAIEDGMDGAFCREADITGQAAQEELPDLAGAPVRFVAFEADDEALELGGELVGVMDGSAGAVGEGLEAMRDCQIVCVRGFREGGFRFSSSCVETEASKAWSASLLGCSERSSPKAA